MRDQKRNKRRRVSGLAVLAAGVLLLAGCAAQPLSRSGIAMDTTVRVTLYDGQSAAALDACFDTIKRYEALFSRTDPDSEIAALNAAGGRETPLSPETRELLEQSLYYGELSGGALDVTIAPASSLWDFSAAVLPDAAALAEAVTRVDYRQLTVTETGACLPAGAAVDVGAVAKGYTADALAAQLRAAGVTGALIDLGGNIYALGGKGKEPFTVGIRDPQDAEALAAVVRVRDRSVVTSGIYERGFTQDGVRYHHLLDPATGRPVQNGLASVTIVSERSVTGDALSTACFVMGLERGMALVESLDGVEALFIGTDGTLHPSSGLEFEER